MTGDTRYKILLSGGGSGGPVSPLLAVADEFKKNEDKVSFFWIGTKKGPEKSMVENEKIEFYPIYSGKLRRYFDWRNFSDILFIKIGFIQSLFLLNKIKPDLIISAGGFVSVPVVLAGWILGIPSIIHQQDIIPGLANKIMAPFSSIVTVAFEKSLEDYKRNALWIGNPVRGIFTDDKENKRGTIDRRTYLSAYFKTGFDSGLPVVLVIGGGTGSLAINRLISKSVDQLTPICNLIHVTGKGKSIDQETKPGYAVFEFLPADKLAGVLKLSDIIVSRCGMGMLSELSETAKPSILIPIPESHQGSNAAVFKKAGAALVLEEDKLDEDIFVQAISELLKDDARRAAYSANIARVMKRGAASKLAGLAKTLIT